MINLISHVKWGLDINSWTMASLSLQLAQWNWISREDAVYLIIDGKTLCSFTVVSNNVYLEQTW